MPTSPRDPEFDALSIRAKMDIVRDLRCQRYSNSKIAKRFGYASHSAISHIDQLHKLSGEDGKKILDRIDKGELTQNYVVVELRKDETIEVIQTRLLEYNPSAEKVQRGKKLDVTKPDGRKTNGRRKPQPPPLAS
jgi:GTP-sensing pleiotropic transcriptional regulator CodY